MPCISIPDIETCAWHVPMPSMYMIFCNEFNEISASCGFSVVYTVVAMHSGGGGVWKPCRMALHGAVSCIFRHQAG